MPVRLLRPAPANHGYPVHGKLRQSPVTSIPRQYLTQRHFGVLSAGAKLAKRKTRGKTDQDSEGVLLLRSLGPWRE